MKRLITLVVLMICKLTIAQLPEWECHYKVDEINTLTQCGDFIWAGCAVGAVSINKNTGEIERYTRCNNQYMNYGIKKIVADNTGAIWMSTNTKGILLKNFNDTWTVFDSITSDLPGTNITDLSVDINNNLWFICSGAYNGLWKYDGTNFINYNTSNSGIPSNSLGSIEADGNNIWIAGGPWLSKFDGTNFFTWNQGNSNIKLSGAFDLDVDNSGNVWTMNFDAIERFNGTAFKYYTHTNSSMPNIVLTSISVDQSNNLWVSGQDHTNNGSLIGGLIFFNGTSFTFYDSIHYSGISDCGMISVFADSDNSIWYGAKTNGTIGLKEGSNWSAYNSFDTEIRCKDIRYLINDSDGNGIIGTGFAGDAFRFDGYNWTDIPYYTESTHGISADSGNNIYIKNQDGIIKFDGSTSSYIPGTPLLQSDGTPWFDPLLIRFDQTNKLWIDYLYWLEGIYDPEWGGYDYFTHEGLASYNETGWSFYNEDNSPLPVSIRDIEFNSSGNAVISTNKGIYLFDGTEWTIYNTSNSSLPYNNISKIALDSLDRIWFNNGLFNLYCFDGINLLTYTCPEYYFSDPVDIIIDKRGIVWQLGSLSLLRFDGTGWFNYNMDNSPLPLRYYNAISCDKNNNLWIGTQYGFLIYNQDGVVISNKEYSIPANYNMTVYPNPARDYTVIYLPETINTGTIKGNINVTSYQIDYVKDLTLNVINTNGSLCFTSSWSDNSKEQVINTSNWKPGLYLIQIIKNKEIISSGKLLIN